MNDGKDAGLAAPAWCLGSAVVDPVLVAMALDDRRHEHNRFADERWRRAVGLAVADAGGPSAYVGSSSFDYATGIATAFYDGGSHDGGGSCDGGGYSGGSDSGGGGGGGYRSFC